MSSSATYSLPTVLGITGAAVVVLSQVLKKSPKYPPGPPKWPILENLLNMPTDLDPFIFSRMAEEYGSDIIHFGAFGQSIVVLNSFEAAEDLLEKRSKIYSSRPRAVMMGDLCGWGWNFAMFPYGSKWREDRRIMAKYVSTEAGRFNEPKELLHARRLIIRLLDNPKDFLDHIRHMVGLIVISTTYGLPVKSQDDPLVELAENAAQNFSALSLAGTWLPDIIPIARYLPSWIPGLKFHAVAEESKKIAQGLKNRPFNAAVERMKAGELLPSLVSAGLEDIMQRQHQGADDELTAKEMESLKSVAAIMFLAGADTSAAVLSFLILALIKNPDVQEKAQKELDQAFGGRLPTHKDVLGLPYLTALVYEAYRWKTTAPLGLPHAVTEDDVYEGYFIPKGSIIVANQHAMMQNETDFPEPNKFNPERFLKDGKINPEVKNPMDIIFGFGRRVCPGSHLAHSIIMITTATMLSILKFEKVKDKNGVEVEPRDEFREGIARQPLPYECVIKPRSKAAEDLVRAWVVDAE